MQRRLCAHIAEKDKKAQKEIEKKYAPIIKKLEAEFNKVIKLTKEFNAIGKEGDHNIYAPTVSVPYFSIQWKGLGYSGCYDSRTNARLTEEAQKEFQDKKDDIEMFLLKLQCGDAQVTEVETFLKELLK